VIGAFSAYVLGTVLLGGTKHVAKVFVVAVLIQVAPLVTTLELSNDASSYERYGSSAHPYGGHLGSVYGPLWTALSRVLDWTGRPIIEFRLLACASVLGITVLVSRLASRRAQAAALVGWNPLFAFHFGGGGHNDALMALLAVGGVALGTAERTNLAGAAWVTSFFVKASTGPLYVLWAVERRRTGRAAGVVGAACAAGLILLLSYGLFGWSWLDAFSTMRTVEKQPASFFWGWIRDLGISYRREISVSEVLWLAAVGWFGVQAWRAKLRLGLAAGTLTLLAPRLEPWYLILPVALAAADDRDRWGKVLGVVLCGIVLTDVLTPALA
jgi:hypothetical protein